MDVYACTEEEVVAIQKRHNATLETIERDVKILNEWAKSQPHFPEKLQVDNFCLKALMHTNYNVELVKQRIENYFTYKNKYLHLYDVFKDGKFALPSESIGLVVPLPMVGPNLERLYAVEFQKADPEKCDIDQAIRLALFYAESGFLFEPIDRNTIICDCEMVTTEYLKRTDFSKLIKLLDLLKNGYMGRIRRVHILNAGTAFHYVINAIQAVLGGVFKSKVHFHENLESLYEHLPPKYLPTEFGGTNGSIAGIIKRMDEIQLETRNHFLETVKYVADESKRTTPKTSTFGVDIFF